MPSGEEIQHALRAFVGTWSGYTGSEKSEAQTFLNDLFACYGTDRRAAGAKFEQFVGGTGFMDLLWPEVCLIEMKAPSVPIETAQAQIERYWRGSADREHGVRAARFLVVCNFAGFEVWEPAAYPSEPMARFALAELPDRYDVLSFLAGPHVEPNFSEHYRELTREAARKVSEVYHALEDRSAALRPEIQRFALQSVWCMFADDLQMMDGFPFQATLNAAAADPDNSAALIGYLFQVLNQKTNTNRTGRLAGTRYVNGALFAEPAFVQLDRDEIRLLLEASAFDWRKVDPTIFGSLMEGVLGHDRRWEIGAHYTHEVDIMKIVGPTIVRPWRERIEATTTPQQAADLLDELCRFRVLDPACGCGNFLYVAYRELRGLEHEIKQRIRRLADETGLPVPEGRLPFYPLSNIQGIDIERAAVQIARVTLWMGHRQMIERYGEAEPPLPLQDLSGIQQADALKVPWPETDCIIGNPPFLGSQHIRSAMGDDYVDWLKQRFGIGVKDFCTYWFRRAADHLKPEQRAGLVGTNSISQNRARSASLEYVVEHGGVITDAVSSQKWPGDAKVHVSLVNWVDEPGKPVTAFTLDGVQVPGITPSLTGGSAGGWSPAKLPANRDRCFQGPIPVGGGFIVSDDEARAMLESSDCDYAAVVRRYLTASDITEDARQAPSRWVIDFAQLPLEEANRFPMAMRIVRDRVRPFRETVNRQGHRERWWQFGEPRVGLRLAVRPLDRCAVVAAHSKRLNIAVESTAVLPSNACMVFAFDDDYSMGVLLSRAHTAWAWAQSSTLETRLRYTPSSVFETFPWPDPVTPDQRERVAEAARRLLARRTEICLSEQIGLTKLYNAVDDGAWTDLAALHKELDEAVVAAYGWPRAVAQADAELVRLLTERNREIVEDDRPYHPFADLDGARSAESSGS